MRAFGRAPYVKSLKIQELEQAIRDEGFEIVEMACHPEARPKPFIVARRV